jgi:hypothetical protein
VTAAEIKAMAYNEMQAHAQTGQAAVMRSRFMAGLPAKYTVKSR